MQNLEEQREEYDFAFLCDAGSFRRPHAYRKWLTQDESMRSRTAQCKRRKKRAYVVFPVYWDIELVAEILVRTCENVLGGRGR